MHIHILGIAGTFMASLAIIAKTLGHQITGSDEHIYPPMSDELSKYHIDVQTSYDATKLPKADLFIIGNALMRGNDCVEKILEQKYRYTSGAQWLFETILYKKQVLAVSGTHGKTTTSSMLAWILDYAQFKPSFLIGGVANNFDASVRLNNTPFFVIEADEYDCAFFDKRAKFIHYHPDTLIINNLEFDHGDIFNSLEDIQKQFCHLIRIMPQHGKIIYPENTANINAILAKECYTQTEYFMTPKLNITPYNNNFDVIDNGKNMGNVSWSLLGKHNASNAIAALFAARHAGVSFATGIKALEEFKGVKRRLEIKYNQNGVVVYDDFAHHPSSISATLSALREKIGHATLIAILELASNTMKHGGHQNTLSASLSDADKVFILENNSIKWDIKRLFKTSNYIYLSNSVDDIIHAIKSMIKSKFGETHIVIMSNSNFGGMTEKLLQTLKKIKY